MMVTVIYHIVSPLTISNVLLEMNLCTFCPVLTNISKKYSVAEVFEFL